MECQAMKAIIGDLINEFYEHDLPELQKRDIHFPRIARKATVVMGMRRTGKTFFCYQEMISLLDSGVLKSQILYINLDDDRLINFSVNDFQTMLDVYYARWPENKAKLCYFFFDEIQTVTNWELFIRRLIDTEKVQVTLTGSSSKLLSTEIATTLRGRTISCEVFPYSFKEYLFAHKLFKRIPAHLTSTDKAKLRNAVADYFVCGGFPEVQGLSFFDQYNILQSYVDSVVLKDVAERHKISNHHVLRQMVSTVTNNVAERFSVTNFYRMLKNAGISSSKNVLYDYLEYFTDAYLFYQVPLHTESIRMQQVNPRKLYVIDNGLQKSMSLDPSKNYGHLLENLVYLELRRKQYTIEYLITKEKYEVDFFARMRGGDDRMLIQVAYQLNSPETLNRELRAMQSAAEYLAVTNCLIVTWDDEREFENGIKAVPIWKFLLLP
jgi:predicted AAA+ superfamily ATPase